MINMKIQDILKGYDIMIDCVPLSITEPGYAYLNACDTGIWVITFNYKHLDVERDFVTIQQIIDVFENNSSYYKTSKKKYEKELPEILSILKKQDPTTKIYFI